MASRHIHLHFDDALHVHPNFKEEQHPRGHQGNPGQFARKGSSTGAKPKLSMRRGVGGKTTPRYTAAPKPKGAIARTGQAIRTTVKGAVHGAGQIGKHIASEFGKEDAHLIASGFHKPGSEQRKSVARHLLNFGKNLPTTLPKWIKHHGKEEYQKFAGATRALRAMATGKKPTHEDKVNLTKAGISLGLMATSLALHDPTGHAGAAVVHGATAAYHAVGALVQEFVQHAAYEHGASSTVGVVRAAHSKLTGSPVHVHVHDDSGDIDYVLLQQFIERLAKTIETKDIPESRVRELLAQQSKPGTN